MTKMNVNVNPTFHLRVDHTKRDVPILESKWFKNPEHFIVDRFPLQLDIETNTVCNLRCEKCFFTTENIEPRDMSLMLLKKVIREGSYKGLESIKLAYRGEPLLYFHLIEAIRFAKQFEIQHVSFNTNGLLLTPEMADNLVDSGLDAIYISVDSYIPEIYNKLHVGGSFSVVMMNILNLQSHKKFKQKTTPILRIQQVVQPDNEHENGFYVKFWEDIADQVSQVEYLPYYDIEPQPVVMEDWACPQLWQRLFVLVDGSVQPCCFLYADKVGNVNLQSIEEIWNGEKMNRFRRLHKEGKSHEIPMCASCYMRKHEYKKAEIKKI